MLIKGVFLLAKEVKLIFIIDRYTHVEAEFAFITFNDLLDRIEDMICDVVKRVLESPNADIVKQLNPVSLFQIVILYLFCAFELHKSNINIS